MANLSLGIFLIGFLFGFTITQLVWIAINSDSESSKAKKILNGDAAAMYQAYLNPENGSLVFPLTEKFSLESLTKLVEVACLVMTEPKTYQQNVEYVRQTWGSRCNKLVVFGHENTEENTIDAVTLSINNTKKISWEKTQFAFMHAYNNFFNDFDWFFVAEDTT